MYNFNSTAYGTACGSIWYKYLLPSEHVIKAKYTGTYGTGASDFLYYSYQYWLWAFDFEKLKKLELNIWEIS